jgi:hypothetical protein
MKPSKALKIIKHEAQLRVYGELTLYIIEQQKEVEYLKGEITKLKK